MSYTIQILEKPHRIECLLQKCKTFSVGGIWCYYVLSEYKLSNKRSRGWYILGFFKIVNIHTFNRSNDLFCEVIKDTVGAYSL